MCILSELCQTDTGLRKALFVYKRKRVYIKSHDVGMQGGRGRESKEC